MYDGLEFKKKTLCFVSRNRKPHNLDSVWKDAEELKTTKKHQNINKSMIYMFV